MRQTHIAITCSHSFNLSLISIAHVANAHRLEKENGMLNRDLRHYKAIYQNVEKLREEKYSLEHQLRSMAVFKDKSVQLEVENAVLKRERAEWYSTRIYFSKPCAVIHRHFLIRALSTFLGLHFWRTKTTLILLRRTLYAESSRDCEMTNLLLPSWKKTYLNSLLVKKL